ncbi:MAG: hypothetical protein IKE03_05045 [Blautia sp.]|nr:hypothetical protein [Blautia sp.]
MRYRPSDKEIRTGACLRILAGTALAVLTGVCLTGCGDATEEKPDMVVESSAPAEATPEPTKAPSYIKKLVYTSADKTVSLRLPDKSWELRAQEKDMHSLASEEQGSVLILHGKGEDALASVVIPDTQDLAVSLEQAAEMEQGLDFVIEDYSATNENGVNIYDYTVHYLNTAKSGGFAYAINKFYVTADEYYNLAAMAKNEACLSAVRNCVGSFKVLDGSVFQSVAVGNDPPQEAAAADTVSMDTPADTAAQTGVQTDGSDDGAQADGYDTGASAPVVDDSGTYSEDELSNTDLTRTIYRNSDGTPIVITPDGNGNWVDSYGNSYWFSNDEDVYDQDDVDYYWHGEAGDVAYMTVGE